MKYLLHYDTYLYSDYRQKKLKEAKRVADEKIEKFKEELERDFEKQKKERYGEQENQAEIERETEKEIESIRGDYDQNKNKVVDFLISKVVDVNIEIPRVVKGDFTSNE